jgi:hypothetical protein
MFARGSEITLASMRVYALAEIGDRLALDVLVRREDAFAVLEELLTYEPDGAGTLFVVPIELDEQDMSAN